MNGYMLKIRSWMSTEFLQGIDRAEDIWMGCFADLILGEVVVSSSLLASWATGSTKGGQGQGARMGRPPGSLASRPHAKLLWMHTHIPLEDDSHQGLSHTGLFSYEANTSPHPILSLARRDIGTGENGPPQWLLTFLMCPGESIYPPPSSHFWPKDIFWGGGWGCIFWSPTRQEFYTPPPLLYAPHP